MVNITPLTLFGLPIVSYLLGSVPCGLILTRRFSDIDVRRNGSENIGATNVYRLTGARLAMITLIADILKGLIPVWLATSITSNNFGGDLFSSIVAMAALLGHLFPVYLRFKEGGKGVATATGCFLIIAPVACTVSIIVFILSVWISNRVSLGSLIATISLPFTVWITTHSVPITGCAGIVAGLIIIRHITNIKRLISGTEHQFRN